MTNILTPMTNILRTSSKKYLRLYDEYIYGYAKKKYLPLLCPLYQWSVELTRQNGGGGGRLRGRFSSRLIPSLYRQAEGKLQSDNINV